MIRNKFILFHNPSTHNSTSLSIFADIFSRLYHLVPLYIHARANFVFANLQTSTAYTVRSDTHTWTKVSSLIRVASNEIVRGNTGGGRTRGEERRGVHGDAACTVSQVNRAIHGGIPIRQIMDPNGLMVITLLTGSSWHSCSAEPLSYFSSPRRFLDNVPVDTRGSLIKPET